MRAAYLSDQETRKFTMKLSRNSANNSRPASANRNPLRSNNGPRVTGFRDLASSSGGGGGQAGGSRFGGFGTGGPGSGSDDDESKDPANFYTGGAKSLVSNHSSLSPVDD